MDCFGTYFTHVQICDVTRDQSDGMDSFGTYFTCVPSCDVFLLMSFLLVEVVFEGSVLFHGKCFSDCSWMAAGLVLCSSSISEAYISKPVCGSVGWGSPISSACLYAKAKTEYNVSTKILVALCIVQGAKEPAQQREI